MYCSGWGFHASWKHLAEAALIWRGVRLLRLVRIRHQKDLTTGLASTNLASLPKEIIRIIEGMIVEAVQPEILSTEPLCFELDDCCLDALADIFEWEPYFDALSEYATGHNFDLGNEVDWTKAVSEFRETAVANQLENTCLDIHPEEVHAIHWKKKSTSGFVSLAVV